MATIKHGVAAAVMLAAILSAGNLPAAAPVDGKQ